MARAQVWPLLPQLGEQRLGAELGIRQPQPADGLKEEAVGHATSPRATQPTQRPQVWGGKAGHRAEPETNAIATTRTKKTTHAHHAQDHTVPFAWLRHGYGFIAHTTRTVGA